MGLEEISKQIGVAVSEICSIISLEAIRLSTLNNKSVIKNIVTSKDFSPAKFQYSLGDLNVILNKEELILKYGNLDVKHYGGQEVENFFNQLTPLVQKERENYNKHLNEFFSPEIDLEEYDF
ncbi:MAG: hypothetical protein PHQ66_03645 [Candidatus Nanoarchaeia archaeon]|nr:hypothetical protein [Candidatus Nanoarchaeia archaeon]MDD5357544.1 hypothetical protein [Candidatus Nanoarchaeia archaeon]MDD5588463.1 hypothetical protein [Candidatus Nanoarchaeia archaeon]